MFRTKNLNILGLNSNASDDDIKKAYHSIALKNHPDKTSNLEESEKNKCEKIFKESSEAYKKLIDNNIMDELNNMNMEDFGFDFDNNENFKDYFNMFSGVAIKFI